MPREASCDWLDLSSGLMSLVSDIEPDLQAELAVEVPRVARKGAKEVKKAAAARWTGKTGQRYSSGFSSKTTRTGVVPTAEIGNSKVPGLVHLLEKGHATLTGRRTEAYPHMAPVFDTVVKPELMQAAIKSVDRALEG